uniref:Uncharacterized protein n=1 Tax=Anguilla anguilla TaxID=7936 RepID=A0A0E9WG01_ANGAN
MTEHTCCGTWIQVVLVILLCECNYQMWSCYIILTNKMVYC